MTPALAWGFLGSDHHLKHLMEFFKVSETPVAVYFILLIEIFHWGTILALDMLVTILVHSHQWSLSTACGWDVRPAQYYNICKSTKLKQMEREVRNNVTCWSTCQEYPQKTFSVWCPRTNDYPQILSCTFLTLPTPLAGTSVGLRTGYVFVAEVSIFKFGRTWRWHLGTG